MHDKDSTPIEAIDIESLQQSSKTVEPSKKNKNTKPYIWFAFLILLLCALSVIFLLPKYVAEKADESIVEDTTTLNNSSAEEKLKVPEPQPAPVSKLSAEKLNALKIQAEAQLLVVIEKQKLLEGKAVKKWAPDEYRIAISLGEEGDEHFRKQNFEQALISYNSTIDVLSGLEEKIAPTLAMHLDKGEQALIKAEKNTAIHHFELVKAIEHSNIQAANGLQRAETIEELYILLEKGGKLEATNRFNDAKNSYQQATELDPLSNEAKQAVKRVNTRLAQIEFNHLMNQGHTSLSLEQYSDARAAFTAAQRLAPHSDKPKQGLAKIQAVLHNKKLAALKAEAQHFETNEDWSNAANTYQQILTLSPNSSAARIGLERNQKRQTILTRLDELNSNFLRLSTKSVADEAQQLLAKVTSLNSPGNKIERAAAELKQQLALAKQPITITLQSDKQTDIAIYKVGKFGKFSSRQVDLKPGKYTIVGSRKGYRDVRKVVTVLAEMSTKTIQVQCDEPI